MKFRILILLLLQVIFVQANVLKPQSEEIPLNATVIVTPENPSVTEKYASELLMKYLPQITSAKYRVVNDKQTVSESFISLGNTAQYRGAGFAEIDLGEVGYRIQEKDGNWFITGGTRSGPVTGVLALLEEDAGCRWYVPRIKDVVPSVPKLKVVPRSFVPPLLVRDPFYYTPLGSPQWSGLNRTNPYFTGNIPKEFGGRFKYSKKYFTHSFNRLFSTKEFGQSNPEFFPVIKGKRVISDEVQRCLSQPAMIDIAVEKFGEDIAKDPEGMVFSISQNDFPGGGCECEPCQALEKAEGTYTGPVLKLANAVAEKMAELHPGKQVSILAYNQTLKPPKTIRPNSNIIVVLCTGPGEILDAWKAAGARLQIWDYIVDFNNYPKPVPNLKAMDARIDAFVAAGAIGIMMQGDHQSIGSSLEALKAWVLAKKLWNPQWSLLELSKDFVAGYYGKAAAPMQQYVELQNRYETDDKRSTLLSPEFVTAAMEILGEAKTLAGDDPVLQKRLKYEEYCVRYLRALQGILNQADRAAYAENLQWLKDATKELKITKFSETGYDRFAEWDMNLASPPYSPNTIRPLPLLWHTANRPTRVDDPDTPSGQTVRQPGKNGEASITYPYGQFIPKMTPGEPYLLRIHYRIEPQPGVQIGKIRPLFVAGFNLPGIVNVSQTVSGSEANTTYQWQPVAILTSAKIKSPWTGKLYLKPVPEAPLAAIYYDLIEIIPLSEYKEALPGKLPEFQVNPL